ncbi:MAG: hypothetical protein AB7P03_18960 [Kofleriaceae bacterium]
MRGVFVVGLLLAAACGSVKDTRPDAYAGDFTMSLGPAELTVPIQGSEVSTLAFARVGPIGDIELSARDVPPGVMVGFGATIVTETETSTPVTIAVAPGAATGPTTLTVVGAVGNLERTAQLTLTIAPMTVRGIVRGQASGVLVALVGKPSVLSDAQGKFTFNDVIPPYDIYTVSTDLGGTQHVMYYDDLTRPDPVVSMAPFPPLVATSGANVSGTKSGGNTSSPLVIAWGDTAGKTTSVNGSNGYALTAQWPFASTKMGTLHALQWTTKKSGEPDTFLGYGHTDAELNASSNATVDVQIQTPPTATVTGTFQAPPGFAAPTITLSQALGNASHALWSASTTMMNATIPIIPAGPSSVFGNATLSTSTSSFVVPALTGDADVSYVMRSPAVQGQPANGVIDVTTSTGFDWISPGSVINQVTVITTGPTKASYEVFTTKGSMTIPIIPELPLPTSQPFTWRVTSYGPHANIDEAASELGPRQAKPDTFTGEPHFSTVSLDRTFTTAAPMP